MNLFEVIKKEKYKNVIIPSLGTGHYGYMHQEVAEMVMQLLCGKQSRKYKEALFKKLLPDLFEKVKKFWTIKLTASGIVG